MTRRPQNFRQHEVLRKLAPTRPVPRPIRLLDVVKAWWKRFIGKGAGLSR